MADPLLQRFRSRSRIVQIRAHQGVSGSHFILWHDIKECFPGVMRVQHHDLFVPMVRNDKLYRVKPHRIKYHPGVTLDVVYEDQQDSTLTHNHASISAPESRNDFGQNVSSANGQPLARTGTPMETDHEDAALQHSEEPNTMIRMTTDAFLAFVDGPQSDGSVEKMTNQAVVPSTNGTHPGASASKTDNRPTTAMLRHQAMMLQKQHQEQQEKLLELQTERIHLEQQVRAGPLNRAKIAGARMIQILKRKYLWIESCAPKLFTILPRDILDEDVDEKQGQSSARSVDQMTYQDFQVQFLCDCSGIPGNDKRTALHLDFSKGKNYDIRSAEMIQIYGEYMLGVLEMVKYGIVMEESNASISVLVETRPEFIKEMDTAIAFLSAQGVPSAIGLYGQEDSKAHLPEDVKPIRPLDSSELHEMYTKHLVKAVRPLGNKSVYMTLDGDIRWLCNVHWYQLSSKESITKAYKFAEETSCHFQRDFGCYRVLLTSREKAREFYLIARTLTAAPVLGLYLDWDLEVRDVQDLTLASLTFKASCLHISVREGLSLAPSNGFDHGYAQWIHMALANKNLQAFVLDERIPEDRAFAHGDDLSRVSDALLPSFTMAHMTRDVQTKKVKLRLQVSHVEEAANFVRVAVNGFHHLSRMHLESNYWENVKVEFAAIDAEVLDIDPRHDQEMTFLDRRGGVDSIELTTSTGTLNKFLGTKCLVDLKFGFTFPMDGQKIRDVIRNNRRLKRLELVIGELDDVCKIYEYFKTLLANHPALESFNIRQMHERAMSSSFVWSQVSDPRHMTLEIETSAGVKIGPVLQKFASNLTRIHLSGLESEEAAMLEKCTRAKKGPSKLKDIVLNDCHKIDPGAIDDLKTVVNRCGVTKIQAEVKVEDCVRLAVFMAGVATKIVRLFLYGEHTGILLHELSKRLLSTQSMPQLSYISLSGPFKIGLQDLAWLRAVVKTSPLTHLDIRQVEIGHEGWMALAGEIDFSTMEEFNVDSSVDVMETEALAAFVEALPDQAPLRVFAFQGKGPGKHICTQYRTMVKDKLKNKDGLVLIYSAYF